MKQIRLTQSEIANAETGYGNSNSYTIIRRLQVNGKQLVASVNINTRLIITSEISETKEDVSKAVKEVNRWMDKCYGGGPMSDKSRHRNKTK